jgi:hypothetical protein
VSLIGINKRLLFNLTRSVFHPGILRLHRAKSDAGLLPILAVGIITNVDMQQHIQTKHVVRAVNVSQVGEIKIASNTGPRIVLSQKLPTLQTTQVDNDPDFQAVTRSPGRVPHSQGFAAPLRLRQTTDFDLCLETVFCP